MKKQSLIAITIGVVAGLLVSLMIFESRETELLVPVFDPNPDMFLPRAEAYQEPVKVAEITGKASYYNRGICELHGTVYGKNCVTRNGQIFDDRAMIAACPKQLLNQYITVTHGEKSITVQCIDTGSFGEKYKRVLDLSQGAFEQLAPASKGVIRVSYSVKK